MSWFALQVWLQHEFSVSRLLAQKGVETFSPSKAVLRRWRDRTQSSEVALFPGYVFARFDHTRKLPVLATPRVQGIVGFGKVPAPIEESEMDAIRRVVVSGLDVESCMPSIGETVEIISGPLAGIRGVFIETRSLLRLVVSVQLIHRSISVEVSPNMLVRAMDRSTHPG